MLAIAALIGITTIAGWRIWDFAASRPLHDDPYAPQAWRSMATVYLDNVKGGFKPDWVCDTDEEFAGTVQKRLGQPLLLPADLPREVEAVGWAYSNTITEETMYLIAKVGDTHVLIFADRASRDEGQELEPGSDLVLFRRQVGKLVLYELTSLGSARVLDLFYEPSNG